MPQLQKEKPHILQQIVRDMQRDGFRGNKDEAAMEHSKRAMPIVRPYDLFLEFGSFHTLTVESPSERVV